MHLHNSHFSFTLCVTSLICLIIIRITTYDKGIYSLIETHKALMFTKEYRSNGNNNTNNLFYDPHTFGIDLFNDSCQIMSPKMFRMYLNTYTNCTGKWCQYIKLSQSNNSRNDQNECYRKVYRCFKGNSRDCYNVEHIIDKNGSEFPDCNKDVVYNYVMAWGTWNQNLGKIARWDYNSSTREKELVYGSDMMSRVREQFLKCCI